MAKRKAAPRRRRTTSKPTRRAASRSRRRKSAARKRATKKRPAPRVVARKASRKKVLRRKSAPKRAASRSRKKPAAIAKQRRSPVRLKSAAPKRKLVPGLDRERRAITDKDEFVLAPPSSLNLDRSASAARSGRRELQERYAKHTETGPAMTGGDVDADWESAYSVGDEAPGGDNPTPDQDIVDRKSVV